MAVRFVLGRAGTGKTTHCLAAVRDALRNCPLDGPRLILLVPEQVSLQMERALLTGATTAAAHRAEVLSFRRLAYRILSTCGDGGLTAISPAARMMLLRLLLRRQGPELRYYHRAARFTGCVEQIGRTITEFIEESIAPEDLPAPQAHDQDDPVRALKLHDLKLIYQSYLDALGTDRCDPSQHLEVARTRVAGCPWLQGAHVWVDGFAGFSRQERHMLAALAHGAASFEITLLIDPDYAVDRSGSNRADPALALGARIGAVSDLFAKTRRTMSELSNDFAEQGIEIAPPHLLRGPPPRFAEAPALSRLEAGLFDQPPAEPLSTQGIRIVQAPDRRGEVEFTVSQILHYVSRPSSPLRYRDIAVIVRDLEPYHALVSAAFNARGIPFFIDRRRSIAHHPLVELLRGLLRLAAEDYPTDAVRGLLKTGLLGLDDAQADELENHLVATAISGRDQWVGADWLPPPRDREDANTYATIAAARVNTWRRAFLDNVDAWVASACCGETASGAEWAERLSAIMRHLSVPEQIERWADEAADGGDLDLAEAHRQAWRDVSSFFDDLQGTLGDERFGVEELSSMVDGALAQLTLGLAPPMLDQVLIGSVERSRQPNVKVALVLGVNDGAFPANHAEDAILNEDDRDWLDEQGLRLGTARRQRILDESLLFYIAVTRAGESLMVTCPEADQDGKTLQPSPFLAALAEACPGLSVEHITGPLEGGGDWSILTDRDLATHLAYEFRHRPIVSDDDTSRRAWWNELYDHARTDEELAPVLAAATRAVAYENSAALSDEPSAASKRHPYRASVSQLETYATCPFKHFAQYRLRLEERKQAQLEQIDVGTVHHAILERFVQTLVDRGQSLADLDEHAVVEWLGESCRYVGRTLPLMGELSHARDRYIMERSGTSLGRVLSDQQRVSRAGSFVPKAAELPFGFEGRGLPALAITTPKGRQVLLRGYIDRVDVAEVSDELLGVVIDYKLTRDKRLDLSGVYHGLSLQLLAYLLVLSEQGATLAGRPIKPAGAFFVSLVDQYRRVQHPGEAEDTGRPGSHHRPRGLLDQARLNVLERDASKTGWSDAYQVYRKTDGGLGHIDKSDAAGAEDLARLMRRTRERLATWCDRIIDGAIAVSPYRLKNLSPCSWCVMRGVCRFEPAQGSMRFLESLKRSEVFKRLAAEEGASTDG